jgi:hypothetical protein
MGSLTGISGAGSSGSRRVGSTSGGVSGSAICIPLTPQDGKYSPLLEEYTSPLLRLTAFNDNGEMGFQLVEKDALLDNATAKIIDNRPLIFEVKQG